MGKKLTKFAPTPEQKKAGLEHVLYEIQRLVADAKLLRAFNPRSVGAKVSLEVTLLHGRVLLEFFERKERSNRRGVENADILSSDFGFPTRDVHLDRSTWNRLNKELAHLSYERDSAPWYVGAFLLPLCERCLEFTETVVSGPLRELVDDEKQIERWRDLQAALRVATQVPPSS